MRGDEEYGYLFVHFYEDPDGDAEHIYFDISEGDNPQRWIPLNGGNPVLKSTLGTGGVRDPYIVRNPHTHVWYILATDFRVFSGAEPDWYEFSHHGSTKLIVWESEDGIHWSEARALDVAEAGNGCSVHLGMAWAPEATWVEDYYGPGDGAFVLYWSSTVHPDEDGSYSQILWGVTRDFTQESFMYGGVFLDAGESVIDATVLQETREDGSVRTYRAVKNNGAHPQIVLDYTDAMLWWSSEATWHGVQNEVGALWDEQGNPGGVEAPALFASHSEKLWYLFVDVIPSLGYRPLRSTNLEKGFEMLPLREFSLAAHTKHGGVMSLRRTEYERLVNYYGMQSLFSDGVE